MADYGGHDHVEECGGQGVFLGHSKVTFERKSKVSAGPGHYGQTVPVCTKESDCIGTRISQASFLIQDIICLLEFQENLEEYRIPHQCKLLDQIGLKGSGTCPTDRLGPVKYIMKRDGCCESAVQKAGD